MNTAAAVDGNKLYPISTFTHVQGAVLDFKQIQAKGEVKLLSVKQPLLNSSLVRNVPSVITVSPVRQGQPIGFVKIRFFVIGFSFYQRLKIIYLLGTKIKPVKFFLLFLFFNVSTCRKKTVSSQAHLKPILLLQLTLVSVNFCEHKHYLFWGRLPAIFTSSEEMLPQIGTAGKMH